MANHKSALKRARQNNKRHLHNESVISEMKTVIKKVKTAVTNKDKTLATATLLNATKIIDKTVSKGTLHWRNGARKVSNLTKLVNSL